jgi:MFS family permease
MSDEEQAPDAEPAGQPAPVHPLREIVQPFIDLIHAPRALWGVNLSYMLEGMVYFGILGYLAIHFSDFVFQGVAHADVASHQMVMVLTAGITISMFFLGFVADRRGVRFALLLAFVLMLAGRILMSSAPTILALRPDGWWSALHLITMGGILLIVVGYGMYQPAAYAAVRKFTTPKTAGMAFAMLYAVMNLGGWFPTFAFLLRDDDFLGLGIPGVFWVYTAFTALALVLTALILTRRTVERATAAARAESAALQVTSEADRAEEQARGDEADAKAVTDQAPMPARKGVPLQLWILVVGILIAVYFGVSVPWNIVASGASLVLWIALTIVPPTRRWLIRHPLADGKFFFFIFALIPVQTLFTYNWFVLPQYISRAFDGWIGDYFEVFSNANPILIFIAAPIVAAVTQKRKVYNMMIIGTFVMAAPAFLLTLGPHPGTLFSYILIMTIGEAMWQPRFLQYAAEIAPEGRTGEYMGVAQLPWFLTKVLVPLIYSGAMMERFCPAEGDQNTELMWMIFGCIAMVSTVLLLIAKPWVGKDFKTKAA